MLQLIWWAHVFLGSGIATFFAWDHEPAAFGDISYWVLTVPNGDVDWTCLLIWDDYFPRLVVKPRLRHN